ncbi:hypothetical protein [Streptomyces sp. Root264]|uniref:hypothetical protein n=1 Tax=Streptomyces sp. Root264 TaxID=1736503 RepID=UPI000B1D76D3|nr:hypothetical protein [Streptomyces sp. Root264]
MSAAKRESVVPGPKALAYGQELKKIFLLLGKSQNDVAKLLKIDPATLSRFFSGMPSKGTTANTVAAKEHADALIRLVRDSGATVTDADIAKIQELRRAAQAVNSSQQVRVQLLQEQLEELQQQLDEVEVRAGTFRGQTQSLEGANSRLEDWVGFLQQRVWEEERRAGREHQARVKERLLREAADSRAEEADSRAEQAALRGEEAERRGEEVSARLAVVEQARGEAEEQARLAAWGAEEAAARLRTVAQARAEAEERAARAVWGADETATRLRALEGQHREALARADEESRKSAAALAELAAARKQLTAAAEYAKTADAKIQVQQEQLRLLRQEVKVLHLQVSKLTEEAAQAAAPPIAEAATQVSGLSTQSVAGGRGQQSGWPRLAAGGGMSAFAPPMWLGHLWEPADGMPALGESGPVVWPETPREERLRARQAQAVAEQARRQRAEEQAELEARQRSAAAPGVARGQLPGQEGARSAGMGAGFAPRPPAGRQSEATGSAASDGSTASAGQSGRCESRFPPPPGVQAEDEHPWKPPQPQGGGRAAARHAYEAGRGNSPGGAQTPSRLPIAPKKRSSGFQKPEDMYNSSSGAPSKRQGAKPSYGGRAAARRSGQSASEMSRRVPAKRASSSIIERQAAAERGRLIRGSVITGWLALGNGLIALALHAMWNSDKAFTSGWWFLFSFGVMGMLSMPVYAYGEVKPKVVKKAAPLFVIAAALVAFACDLYSLTPHVVHQGIGWVLRFLLRQA